jgi:hypothetical protein
VGADEPLLGPLALFGGIGLAAGVLVTAGVTLFVFRDISSTDVRAATPTARPVGITLLREFGGQVGTPTPQPGVAAGVQASDTRPPLGSALAALAEQEAAQRASADSQPPAPQSQPAPAAPARSAPAPIAPYSAPSTFFEPPAPPRPTDTARPVPADAPRPTPTLEEEVRAVREPGPVSPPRTAVPPTVAPPRATPPVVAQTPVVAAQVARPTPPISAAPATTPAGSGTSSGSLPITAAVTTPTRTIP